MAKYGKGASKRVESAMRRKKKGTLKSGSGAEHEPTDFKRSNEANEVNGNNWVSVPFGSSVAPFGDPCSLLSSRLCCLSVISRPATHIGSSALGP